MKDIALITGAGTGIGKALAVELANNHEMQVLAIGRRVEPLQQTVKANPELITYCSADISTEEGRHKIVNALNEEDSVRFLVHNAAILTPVKNISEITPDEWRKHQSINVEGPLFLTQALLSKMDHARILNISSGAAHRPMHGWAAYCTSKAALFMLYRVMNTELNEKNIFVGSVRPGVVNTPMQDEVRDSNPEAFPALPMFYQYKDEGKLIPPDVVAKFLAYLLFDTADEDFSSQEWDIYSDYKELSGQYKR
ncbi:MAG: SDR family NAD(P)-dependent oxidoreductase [Calditrichaceae bacterium]|jgi:benzil reductase ((S)-benzoin forming)